MPIRLHPLTGFTATLIALLCLPSTGMAQDESVFSAADTAWILTSTALVLFMTLPGLALFYGGQWITAMSKQRLRIDDSLDVFAVHGVGGIIGTILVAFLATPTFGGLGLAEGQTAGGQLVIQLTGLLAVGVWTAILTFIIIKLIGALVGLRVSEEVEIEGLDITVHGERGYEL